VGTNNSTRTYSSNTVFIAIGLVLVAMTFFMFVCKHFGMLNPRATWDKEFQELKNVVLAYHRDNNDRPAPALSPQAIAGALEFYAGSQLKLRPDSKWQAIATHRETLNGKPVIMIRFVPKGASDTAARLGSHPEEAITFAIFPIAERQLQKAFKFTHGSFLWYTYLWNQQNTSFVVNSALTSPGSDQLSVVSANYLNDYFVFVTGAKAPRTLATQIFEAVSFYHEDFMRVL
jgi:hypothetical protein